MYVTGLVHGAGVAPSIAHAKVAGSIVEWKLNVAVPEVDGFAGPLSITVSAMRVGEGICLHVERPPELVGRRDRDGRARDRHLDEVEYLGGGGRRRGARRNSFP